MTILYVSFNEQTQLQFYREIYVRIQYLKTSKYFFVFCAESFTGKKKENLIHAYILFCNKTGCNFFSKNKLKIKKFKPEHSGIFIAFSVATSTTTMVQSKLVLYLINFFLFVS